MAMNNMIIKRRVGKCAVIAQSLGWDYEGQTEYGFYAALCIDNEGRPCHAEAAAHFIRLTRTTTVPNALEQMTCLCRGYSLACEHHGNGHSFGSITRDELISH